MTGSVDDQLDDKPGVEPAVETLAAHLAGVERGVGTVTLWLSDETTTMHFPLTEATVPALLDQLHDVDDAYRQRRAAVDERAAVDGRAVDGRVAVDEQAAEDLDRDAELEEEPPGRLARWTGWHYSNELVRRIPAQQRVALFAAVLVILLLITLFARH